jgi:fido (protein-threonine AMPylation protein)
MECMGQLEEFLHDETHGLPLLVKAGLVHVQFETIHPFLDGNGRVLAVSSSLFYSVHEGLFTNRFSTSACSSKRIGSTITIF